MLPAKKSRNECGTCGKVFTRPDNLKQHQLIHRNEKQHECAKCGKGFRRKTHLKRHDKQLHERRGVVREYACNICGEEFHNMAPFRAHHKTAYAEPSTSKNRASENDIR